jgi:hypothetical protein
MRSPNSGELFRLTLRRYEVMKNKKHRFHFTAMPLDLPFDIPIGSRHETLEAILYHLVNLTWYFRRRIVDQLYTRVIDVASMKVPEPKIVEELYRDLGQELMQIHAQCIIRGIDNPNVLKRALGPENPETQSLLSRVNDSIEFQQQIFQAFQRGPAGLHQIAENLHKIAEMNYDWYKQSAASYAHIAQALTMPESPNG